MNTQINESRMLKKESRKQRTNISTRKNVCVSGVLQLQIMCMNSPFDILKQNVFFYQNSGLYLRVDNARRSCRS